MAKLNFSIVANLLSDGVERGAAKIQTSLNGIRMRALQVAGVFGTGLGLAEFGRRLLDASRALADARRALSNVSKSAKEYADTERFLIGLSKKYKQEISGTIKEYAKFKAAADNSNVSIEDQRRIFESLSKASFAFGLSAEDSRLSFLAVTQMMGKGKVSAEELRGQLAEKIPVAVQAMAKGLGVSTAELEKMLKAGKIASADALPKFAKALDEMTKVTGLETPTTALTDLSNKITEVADKLKVADFFTGVVKGATSLVGAIGNNIRTILQLVGALILGRLAGMLGGFMHKLKLKSAEVTAAAIEADGKRVSAAAARVAAENNLASVQTRYETIENGKRLASARERNAAEAALRKAKAAENRAILLADAAAERAALARGATGWGGLFGIIKGQAIATKATLKAMWASLAPMLFVTGVVMGIAKLVELRVEAKRVAAIFREYRAEADKASNTAEIARLKAIQGLLKDANTSESLRKRLIGEINTALGTEYNTAKLTGNVQDEINAKIKERIRLLENAARAEYYSQKIPEYEDKINPVKKKYPQLEDAIKYTQEHTIGWAVSTVYDVPIEIVREQAQNIEVLNDAKKNLAKAIADGYRPPEAIDKSVPSQPAPEKADLTPLQKAEQEYRDAITAATNRLAAESKYDPTAAHKNYTEAVYKASRAFIEDAGGILGGKAERNKLYNEALKVVQSYPNEEVAKAGEEYRQKVREAANLLSSGAITQEEAGQILYEAAKEAKRKVGGLLGAEALSNETFRSAGKSINRYEAEHTPTLQKRDTLFDYKKDATEKLREEMALLETYIEELKKGSGELYEELLKVANVKMLNLQDALKVAEVTEDVKRLQKELSKTTFDGVKNIAQSADRLVSGINAIGDAFDKMDESPIEGVIALFNGLVQTADTVMSVVETIEGITQAMGLLSGATAAAEAIGATAAATSATSAGTAITAAAAKAAADKVASDAAFDAAVTSAAASVAAIPIAGPGLAVAAAASVSGAMIAAMAAKSVGKFASGGVISGAYTSGDRLFAQVNAGEMILNSAQQAKLFKAVNKGGFHTTQTVVVGGRLTADGKKLSVLLKEVERRNNR